ncbi:MAG TPA: hypothetical protein VGU67_02830 [Edaphobacter sp.]|nr:hypothetical protein [Edaphobacter sp.]
MENEEYRGLSIDLTNCLQSRNQELVDARRAIGSLLTAIAVDDCDKQRAINQGRDWLKRYNDRMYPKPKSVTSSPEQEAEIESSEGL